MNISAENGVAIIESGEICLYDAQSALDIIGNVRYNHDCGAIVLRAENFPPEFFELRSGLLGEVFQKFTTYDMKLAIIGDFSNVQSKSLRDFIYETNKGGRLIFAPDKQSAIEALSR